MKRKILVATGCSLAAVLLFSMIGSWIMSSRAVVATEPSSLSDLVNYPGEVMSQDLTAEQIQTELVMMDLSGTVRGIPVQGLDDVKRQLMDKGLMPNGKWAVDSFFDVFTDMYVGSPDGLEYLQATAFKGWTKTMLQDGSKAMIAGAVLFDPQNPQIQYSMIVAVPTNVLPPEQMPGVDPYIIWNAEPYFYVQHYWWVWPYARLVSWRYWWYDSHKAPNWFWGTYWWWRTYIKYYGIVWHWWYWWWWSWYYWRGWYWWSTYWPYI